MRLFRSVHCATNAAVILSLSTNLCPAPAARIQSGDSRRSAWPRGGAAFAGFSDEVSMSGSSAIVKPYSDCCDEWFTLCNAMIAQASTSLIWQRTTIDEVKALGDLPRPSDMWTRGNLCLRSNRAPRCTDVPLMHRISVPAGEE